MKKNMPGSGQDDVKTHFDILSDRYSKNYSSEKSGKTFIFRTRMRIVETILEGKKGALLDCASGSGEITAQILTVGKYETGTVVDLSEKMLGLAESEISKCRIDVALKFVNANIFDFLAGCEERYDTVLCLGLIAHTGDIDNLLRGINKCLNPGGKLVLQSSLRTHIGIKLVKILTEKKYRKVHGYSISYYSIKDIEKACENSGLKLSSTWRYGFSFPFGDRVFRYGNYCLELLMSGISTKFGSDAVFVIEKPES